MSLSPTIRIGVAGAQGRMGRAVTEVVEQRAGVMVATSFDHPGASDADLAACDVIIDFTTPSASASLATRAAAAVGPALVIGSTGVWDADDAALRKASETIGIVRSGNFSLGVNVLAGLVNQAARRLSTEDWDIEIFEAHHRRKVDAPSGTALMLGEAAAKGRGVALSEVSERARDGLTGPRQTGAIGFSVLRGGGVVGEHSVVLAAEDEILTLSHSARDRRLFARGAVEAAVWVAGRPPGLYDMMDVLGFRGS